MTPSFPTSFRTPSLASTRNASARFADEFGVPLPRGLREQAAQASWAEFLTVHRQPSGPLQLRSFVCLDGGRPTTRLGPQGSTYQATITVGDRSGTCAASASGPLAALTMMLHQLGIGLEMLCFHQVGCPHRTATCIRGSDGRRAAWAMGLAPGATQSALEAVIGCANRLLTA